MDMGAMVRDVRIQDPHGHEILHKSSSVMRRQHMQRNNADDYRPERLLP